MPSIGSTCSARSSSGSGVEGDWQHPYTTMSFDAEATIAAELMKFAMNGLLYRGSKPVMWSVVEKTALAEAEVEYAGDHQPHDLCEVSVVELRRRHGPSDDEFSIPTRARHRS